MATSQDVKCVVVGDGAVGKSCLLISYVEGTFPSEYGKKSQMNGNELTDGGTTVPTVFDLYESTHNVQGKHISLSLWDTAGQEGYARIRTLSYPKTSVFLLCCSVVKWLPEIRHNTPATPIILVGTKIDLKHNRETLDALERSALAPVTQDQGMEFARRVGAVRYLECSALTREGVNEVFEAAMMTALSPEELKRRARQLKRDVELGRPVPPVLPPAGRAPWIEIITSTYSIDWKRLVNNRQYSDVCFVCDDGNGTVYAHSVPLAAGSSVLRKLLWKASALTPKSTEDKAAKPTSSYSETVQLGEAFECPICNERCLGPILQCENGHSFCSRCIIKWVENNHNCAMCRVDISSPSKLIRNRALEELHGYSDRGRSEGSAQTFLMEERDIVSIEDDPLPNGIVSVYRQQPDSEKPVTTVIRTTCKRLQVLAFVEFLYSGSLPVELPIVVTPDFLRPLLQLASSFDCPQLRSACRNIIEGDEEFNPSIGTWFNDLSGYKCGQLFLSRPSSSDVSFLLDNGSIIPAHLVVLSARCPALERLCKCQRDSGAVEIDGIEAAVFRAVLEFVYTAHATMHSMEVLMAANRFELPRLVTLCELYQSKSIETACVESIRYADINVIGILNQASANKASQLERFCLHFISTNFKEFHDDRKEWKDLSDAHRAIVTRNQWPPQSYETAAQKYERELEQYEATCKKRERSRIATSVRNLLSWNASDRWQDRG